MQKYQQCKNYLLKKSDSKQLKGNGDMKLTFILKYISVFNFEKTSYFSVQFLLSLCYESFLNVLPNLVIKFINVCETLRKCLGHSTFLYSMTTSDKRCLNVCTTTFMPELSIYQGSEYARVLNMQGLHKTLNKTLLHRYLIEF